MRKMVVFALLAAGIALSAAAQPATLSPLSWQDARSMGSGGTSLLFSTGYDSFFGNPAGFAGPGSLTLGDASFWGYVPTTPASLNELKTLFGGDTMPTEEDSESIIDSILTDNADQTGFGGSVGLGWAGKGFGLGFNMVSEATVLGSTLAGSDVAVKNQLNAVLGFALPVRLGPLTIQVGADARAFYRLDSIAANWTDAHDLVLGYLGYNYDFASILRNEWMTGGFGYAFDAGATLKLGPFMAGFMARDLMGVLTTGDVQVGDLVDNSNLPMDGTDEWTIEPTYTAGIGLKFNEDGLLAPSIYAETDDIPGVLGAVTTGLTDTDALLAKIRVGGELRLLKIFLLRGGLNENCLSLGAGVDLHLIRVDAAIFGEDIGSADPRSGFSLRAAVKF